MPAVIPFIPLIASGISAVGGAISAKKKSNAQKKAMAADAPLRTAQTAGAQQQQQQGAQLFQTGMPLVQQSGDFYSRLLTGDRAALRSTTAPERSEITDIYRGAESNLDRSGVRGASRDVASANLARDKAGRLGNLAPMMRAGAAGSAAQLGLSASGAGQQGLAASMGSLDALMGRSLNQQQLQFQQGEANANRSAQFGEDAGMMLTDFIKAYQNRGASSTPGVYGGGSYTTPALASGQGSAFGGIRF